MNRFSSLPGWAKGLTIVAGVAAIGYGLYLLSRFLLVFLVIGFFSGLNDDKEAIFGEYRITADHHWYLIFKDTRGLKLLDDPQLIARYKNDVRTRYRTGEDGFLAGLGKQITSANLDRRDEKYGVALYRDGGVVRSSWVIDPNRVTYGRGLDAAFPVVRCTVAGERDALQSPFGRTGAAWSWIYPAEPIPAAIDHDVVDIVFPAIALEVVEKPQDANVQADKAAKTFDIGKVRQSIRAALRSALAGETGDIDVEAAIEDSAVRDASDDTNVGDTRILFGTARARVLVPPGTAQAVAARLADSPAIATPQIAAAALGNDRLSQFLRRLEKDNGAREMGYRPASRANLSGRSIVSTPGGTEKLSMPFFVRPEDKARTDSWPGIDCSSSRYD